MAEIEKQLIDDMVATDRRGLPLMSKEEMANRGLIYDERSGVYKTAHRDNISVNTPKVSNLIPHFVTLLCIRFIVFS